MNKKNNQKKTVKKSNAWFWHVRGSYLPASGSGWLTYVPFIAYLAFSVIVGVKDISRVWVAVLFIIPNWIAAASIMTYLASKKS